MEARGRGFPALVFGSLFARRASFVVELHAAYACMVIPLVFRCCIVRFSGPSSPVGWSERSVAQRFSPVSSVPTAFISEYAPEFTHGNPESPQQAGPGAAFLPPKLQDRPGGELLLRRAKPFRLCDS